MKHFDIKELESNIDYLLSISELGKIELIDDFIKALKTNNREEIINGIKSTLILWYFYIKISNEVENYELSQKIKRVIELEKQEAVEQLINFSLTNCSTLSEKEAKRIESLVDEIDNEIGEIILN